MSAQPIHDHGPVPREPAAIRAALPGVHQAAFDAEYEPATERLKAPTYDLAGFTEVVRRWWVFVNLPAHTAEEDLIAATALAGGDVPGVVVDVASLRKTA